MMDKITGLSQTITTSLKTITNNFEYVGNGILFVDGIAITKVLALLIAQLRASLYWKLNFRHRCLRIMY